MRPSLAAFFRDKSGAAAAEMALATPLLMIIIFGAFEAGNFFWNEHVVIKAVRDGARFAGRQSFSMYDCGANSVNSTVASQVDNLTRTGQTTSGGAPRVTGWTGGVTITVACQNNSTDYSTKGIYTNHVGGAPVVTVSTSFLYTPFFGSLGFDTSSLNLTASAQSAVMGI